MGEAISKEVISELEAALRETDLKQETIDSIIRSLKFRHRRWLAVRWAAVIVSIAALCAVFYLGILVGRNRSTAWPVANSGPRATQETPSLPEVKMPSVLVPEILGIPSEPSDFMETFSVETEQEPKTEERVEEIIEDKSVPVAPKSISKELIVSKEAAPPPLVQKPKATVVEATYLYAVELIGFSSPKESAGLNKKLRKQGYSSSLHKKVASDGTVLYRVWIGHFKTSKKARDFIDKLRRNEGLEGKMVERTN